MFLCLLVAAKIFPRVLPLLMGFPREVGRSGSAVEKDTNFAKICFEIPVGEWSARTGKHPGSLLVFFALWHFDSGAHNPEVVGSSPASATISQASLSHGSEVSFCPKSHWEVFVSNGKQTKLLCSIWAANRAANAKIRSIPPSARRRRMVGNNSTVDGSVCSFAC